MASQKKTLKVKAVRSQGQSRTYSNYVEVTANPVEVNIKFCDVRPPASKEELVKVKSKGIVETEIRSEIVMPIEVARAMRDALAIQIEVKGKKK